MRDEQIKELISAYIDDELSVDERTLVERHLADSVESRQFLDQLQRQRTALRSVPRLKLKDDFSQRVLEAIENARPTLAPMPVSEAGSSQVSPGQVSSGTHAAWWKTWRGISTGIATVAALVLLALFVTRSGNGTVGPRPNELVGPDKGVPQDGPQQRPEDVKPPEESGLPTQQGVDEPLSGNALLAVGEFQKLVLYVAVYDITLTPAAQQKRVFEAGMDRAGIPVNKGIRLDQRLEEAILAARFVQDAKVVPVGKGKQPAEKNEVEMFFVRGTNKHIDSVGRYLLAMRADQVNPEVQLKMDLVVAPKDLYVFMQLNQATGLDVARMKSSPAELRKPAAFPLQFHQSMQSLASVNSVPVNLDTVNLETALAMATDSEADSQIPLGFESFSGDCSTDGASGDAASQTLVAQVAEEPAQQPEAKGTNLDDPTQAIFIIRRLSEEPNAN